MRVESLHLPPGSTRCLIDAGRCSRIPTLKPLTEYQRFVSSSVRPFERGVAGPTLHCPDTQPLTLSAMSQVPVTVIVPVKNEEQNLPSCLEPLVPFRRVLVVDSASTDGTREVAAEYGAEVVQFEWDGKYPKKRNWVLDNHQVQTTWVLFLDADEIVTEDFVDEVRLAVDRDDHVGFWLTYHNYFMGRRLRHGDRLRKLALFRVDAGRYERIDEDRWSHLDVEIHEHPILEGKVGRIHSPIDHRDLRGLHHHIEKHNEYSSWEAHRYLELGDPHASAWMGLNRRQRSKYRHLDRWWLAPAYFFASYVVRRGFLDGQVGFAFAVFKATYFIQIRNKIHELRMASGADQLTNTEG